MTMYIHQQQEIREYGDDNGRLINLLRFQLNNIRAIILQGKKYQYYTQVNDRIKQTISLAKHIKTKYDNQDNHLNGNDIYRLKNEKNIAQVNYGSQNKQPV